MRFNRSPALTDELDDQEKQTAWQREEEDERRPHEGDVPKQNCRDNRDNSTVDARCPNPCTTAD
jgi:hypothetical protein